MKTQPVMKTRYSIRKSRSTGLWYVLDHYRGENSYTNQWATSYPRYGAALLAMGFKSANGAMTYLADYLKYKPFPGSMARMEAME